MKLVVSTQVRENYGAHDWDGEGECPEYWKNKGGEYYQFTNFVPDYNNLDNQVKALIVAAKIEENSNYYKEFVIGWEVVEDSYVSPDESIQVEYSQGDNYFNFDVRFDAETLEKTSIFRGYDGKWYKRVFDVEGLYEEEIEEQVMPVVERVEYNV